MKGSNASYQIIADLLAAETGQQLTESRRWRVETALGTVFREAGISNVDQLVCLLDDPQKTGLGRQVVEALLNNESYFFRDKPTFDQLPGYILPLLAERRSDRNTLSIWCAGCSTGQEVYSIAMLIADNPDAWKGWTIDILGTDVSHRAISAARKGLYSQFEVQRGLAVTDMLRHFDETEKGWQIREPTRTLARFGEHNILSVPPSRSRFDLILCRNVLLYFDRQTRRQAFERLSGAIANDGFLMLGAGETVTGQTTQFDPIAGKASLFAPCQDMSLEISDSKALQTP